MTLYQTVVDPAVANSSHTIITKLVGHNQRVLDVGCATGYLARALRDQGCSVSGLEYDAEAGEQARSLLDRLVIGDLNALALSDAFPGAVFDKIVFGDVLEHLLDPAAVLRSAMTLLAPGGAIVVSIPNVAHGSLRLALLQGAWEYRDTGLLDRTHIRFFTLDGLQELLTSVGLVATDLNAVVLDPLAVEVRVDQTRLPAGVVDWVRHQPEAFSYQYVLRAEPAAGSGLVPVTTPTPAVEQQPVVDANVPPEVLDQLAIRLNAQHAAAAAQAVGARQQLLTARDNAIGLENVAAFAQTTLAETRHELAEIHRLLGEVLDENARLARVIQDRDDEIVRVKSSITWRAGSVATKPMSRLRGGRP